MRGYNRRKIAYVAVFAVMLILCALPLMIRDDVAITRYSIVPIAFAVCSAVYAGVAFLLRDKGNLFAAGRCWFYRALSMTFSEQDSLTDDEAYKREFALSAFVYCVSLPVYITLAFFAADFYSTLSQALGWTIVRMIAVILVVILPPMIKRIKADKQQRIRDEADRKEQDRLESMGKWK